MFTSSIALFRNPLQSKHLRLVSARDTLSTVIFKFMWHVGDVIRKMREQGGLKRGAFAKKIHLGRNALGRLEASGNSKKLPAIAVALGISLDELYKAVPEKTQIVLPDDLFVTSRVTSSGKDVVKAPTPTTSPGGHVDAGTHAASLDGRDDRELETDYEQVKRGRKTATVNRTTPTPGIQRSGRSEGHPQIRSKKTGRQR